jgi:hypothetical protein
MAANEGRVFEDFSVGMLIRHPLGRTVTAADDPGAAAAAAHAEVANAL